ncbi:Bicarbonate transporter BicA [Polystyrenella longa]|uniref:Bicarbonate transporter BicA n=1 Tax=Polystyrenella longa TaxID=2528007 RepID=A0A518CM02_9PLAN|nr:SulP family inorganic anion transporter [Polystyrenella longa]QDU80247.1 Bicarbonate transporter BicA [Polystyrenella longa]
MIDLLIKRQSNFKNEFLSGLTVALALVPEAVAFAFVAGVDPLVGLWAAFIMGFVTSILGGRPGMISGATGAMAVVMTAFIILHGIEYMFAAVILCGIIQILCGVFKLGKLVRILPHPVTLGFVNGLAIVIGLAQFGQFKENYRLLYDKMTGNFQITGDWMSGGALLTTLCLIGGTMLIIHYLPRFTKAVPGTLVAIVAMTLLVNFSPIESVTVQDFVESQNEMAAEKTFKSKLFNEQKEDLKLSEIDAAGTALAAADVEVPEEESTRIAGAFQIPSIDWTPQSFMIILGLALTLSAVGLIESLMTLTLIDELTQTRGSSNRECIGQGAANIICGLFGGMGGCAMIGQSMINIRSGGRGRLSGICAASFLLCFIIFPPLWNCIGLIPVASLVGVMFIVVIATFEWTTLRLWNKIPGSDFLVIILVSAMTVIFDLAIAVVAGVAVSSLVFAWKKSTRLNVDIIDDGDTRTYVLKGSFFFGAVSSFKEFFDPINDPEHVVIEFQDCTVYDHSALEAINAVAQLYRQQGKQLTIMHLKEDCARLVRKADDVLELNVS